MALALGTVYACLLNSQAQWQAAKPAGHAAPYVAMPKAPVLYIKPHNTFNAGATVPVPSGHAGLGIGASLGLVFMPNFTINPHLVTQSIDSIATDSIAWCQIMIDWQLPHGVEGGGLHRPPLKYNAHDGMLGLGSPRVMIGGPLEELLGIDLVVQIGGEIVLRWSMRDTVRSPARLLAAVMEFMTPQPLDALLLGQARLADGELALAKIGQKVSVHSPTHPSLGSITQTLVAA